MTVYIPSTGGKVLAWGPPTAKMNFCEEDYHVSSYIAEFVNCLTNLAYVYLGCCGLHNHLYRSSFWTFFPLYASIIAVGIGSGLYHGTLKYSLQLVDDLSMLFGAAIVLHMVLTFQKSKVVRVLTAIALGLALTILVWRHISTGKSGLHQIAFVLMIWTVAYRTMVLMKLTTSNLESRKRMRGLAKWGCVAMVSGYLVWLADVFLCTQLRKTRRSIGLPWAWLLELHGWWHILTAIGVYLFIVLVECIHVASKLDPDEFFEPSWRALLRFPHELKLVGMKKR